MTTKDEALKLALEALEYWQVRDEFNKQTADAITAIREVLAQPERPAVQGEPVKFLANGTRFKMSFFETEEDGAGNQGAYVTCFEAFEKELDGRWVALVAAEDDCHLHYTTPQPAVPAVAQGEPVAWTPIEQPYPQGSELDILMGDGSILCAVLPQADGDLWWDGSGTGEKFIDPQYANVTHWRVHSDTTPQPAVPDRKPLTEEQIDKLEWAPSYGNPLTLAEGLRLFAREVEAAHGITGEIK